MTYLSVVALILSVAVEAILNAAFGFAFHVAFPLPSEVNILLAPAPVGMITELLNVAAPVAVTEVNVVAPVTPKVPPTVVLPVKVDAPVTFKVLPSVVAPVTPNVPPTVSLPVIVALANVLAPADNVDENVPAPLTDNVLPNVVAPVAFRVEDKLNEVPVATPITGVTKVGLVAKTKLPEPVEVVVPVPPCATSIVDALQVPLVIVPTVTKFDNEVNVVFVVAVMFPAVVAVVALPVVF